MTQGRVQHSVDGGCGARQGSFLPVRERGLHSFVQFPALPVPFDFVPQFTVHAARDPLAKGQEILANNIGLVEPGLWAKKVDGGEARLVTADASLRTYPLEWTLDGTIYLLDPDGVVLTLADSGGPLREFGRLPEAPIWEGWADVWIEGDSLYLACSIDEPRESDVWVLDRGAVDEGGI